MVSSLAARVAKLEGRRTDGLMCILLHGGPPDDFDASAGFMNWRRCEGEPFDDFVARTKAEARASGEKILIIHAEADAP